MFSNLLMMKYKQNKTVVTNFFYARYSSNMAVSLMLFLQIWHQPTEKQLPDVECRNTETGQPGIDLITSLGITISAARKFISKVQGRSSAKLSWEKNRREAKAR